MGKCYEVQGPAGSELDGVIESATLRQAPQRSGQSDLGDIF
jgi:hypothetical protein